MGDWDDLVVVCGATPFSGVRLLDQHIAEHLTSYAPVMYVDPPVSALTRFRNPAAAAASHAPGLSRLSPRLSLLSPRVLPLKERPLMKQIALAQTRRAMKEAVRSLGSSSVRAVIVPSLDPLFGALGERFSVFYASDDFVAGAELMGIAPQRLRRRARRQPRDADVVVAVSPHLVDDLSKHDSSPVLIPNGCDVEHFSAAGPPPPHEPRTVAFVGHLSDRVDATLLEAVARTGAELLLIGAIQTTMKPGHFDEVLAYPNVHWHGQVDYERLPELLSGVTTCLLPYGDTAFNRASFPLKVLEYLAAGRRVVSTRLPAVDWLDTELVVVADGPIDFAQEVASSVREPLEEAEVDRRKNFASAHSWESRMRTLASLLELVPAEPSVGLDPS